MHLANRSIFPISLATWPTLRETLGTNEFIDLVYNPAGGSSAALNANLTRLVLDAGNQGHSYTIEQSSFGGSLSFGADAVTGPATIVVGNDAGNDVISAPIFMTTASHHGQQTVDFRLDRQRHHFQ